MVLGHQFQFDEQMFFLRLPSSPPPLSSSPLFFTVCQRVLGVFNCAWNSISFRDRERSRAALATLQNTSCTPNILSSSFFRYFTRLWRRAAFMELEEKRRIFAYRPFFSNVKNCVVKKPCFDRWKYHLFLAAQYYIIQTTDYKHRIRVPRSQILEDLQLTSIFPSMKYVCRTFLYSRSEMYFSYFLFTTAYIHHQSNDIFLWQNLYGISQQQRSLALPL